MAETYEASVRLALAAAAVYAVFGGMFALAFLVRGVLKIDAAAQGTTPGFRLMIVPGVVVFWPLLAHKWASAGKR